MVDKFLLKLEHKREMKVVVFMANIMAAVPRRRTRESIIANCFENAGLNMINTKNCIGLC